MMVKLSLSSFLVVFSLMLSPLRAHAADIPVMTSLVNLHKTMYEAEIEAHKLIDVSVYENIAIKENTDKFHEIRTVIDSKVKSGTDAWIYITSLSRAVLDLAGLIDSYKDLSRVVAKNITDNPRVGLYFSDASYRVLNIVKRAEKLCGTMGFGAVTGLFGTDLTRFTYSDRYKLLCSINSHIGNARWVLHQAYLKCSLLVDYGWSSTSVLEDMYNSEVFTDVTTQIVTQIYNNTK